MRVCLLLQKCLFLLVGLLSFGLAVPQQAVAATLNGDMEQQIMADINQDRIAAGLSPLTLDPRLRSVAEARAEYLIAKGFFSHCTGGESDTNCRQSGYDFLARDAGSGLNVTTGGTTLAENLALNNYPIASAATQTNASWLQSPEHRANLMASNLSYTGVGVACCFTGNVGGQGFSAAENVYIYVQDFSGGPGAVPAAAARQSGGTPGCRFVLGFASLASMLPHQVGGCSDDEGHSAQNGDAFQHTTTGGMMVWRKADNWTAYTDGFHSWINGPGGLEERLNTQRFRWEANPSGLPVI